ncbi:hypothetical protein [Streptomyces sp. PA5.6]|uniref:hypothetical protein n=1 Tax=Streptomyces sp. PA5.6 TaxID=3035651 RepID=UPI00390498F5
MNTSKRMLTALTLTAAAAASVAAAAPAQAAPIPGENARRSVGHVVGETLMDPAETGRDMLDAGKTGLTVIEIGMKSVRTSSRNINS